MNSDSVLEAKIGTWLATSKLLPKSLVNWAGGHQVAPNGQKVPPITPWQRWNAENQKKLYRYTDRYTGCSGTQPHGAKLLVRHMRLPQTGVPAHRWIHGPCGPCSGAWPVWPMFRGTASWPPLSGANKPPVTNCAVARRLGQH